MTLHEVLSALHSDDPSEVLNILNKATYVEKYDIKQKAAVHTGVTFKIHTGKKFEILHKRYDHDLLFQPCDYFESPCIAGLLMYHKERPFFDCYDIKQLSVKR